MDIWKLIKHEDRYDLYDKSTVQKIASTAMKGNGHKLSIKNCEAIENGYDLDELAREAFKSDIASDYTNIDKCITDGKIRGFIRGFQKALELLGGKKFSEEDILRLAIHCWNIASKPEHGATYNINNIVSEYIQSSLQTEFDVVIDVLMTERERGIVIENPKLDKDGCLILKRKI